MFKRNQIFTSVVTASMVAGIATSAMADEKATGQASVTVTNTFNLDKVADLTFGTIQIVSIDDDVAAFAGDKVEITMESDGSGGSVVNGVDDANETSTANIITDGSPAEFAISAAAPNTVMTLTLPGDADLTPPAGGAAAFTVAFNNDLVTVVNSDGSEVDFNGANLVTDATGAVSFRIGGVLTPADPAANDTNIADGAYIGDFEVTVDY